MKFSPITLAIGVFSLASAVAAGPDPQEDQNGYSGAVIPPCSNVRCRWGAPFYDRRTRSCLCPPINCPAVTTCQRGSEAYYDWNLRDCNCRRVG